MSSPRPAVMSVGLATAFSAVSGYLVLLLAARSLTESQYAGWFVFWSAFGLTTGLWTGVLQETSRSVRASCALPENRALPLPPGATPGLAPRGSRSFTRPLRVAVIGGIVFTIITLGTLPLWAPALFADSGSPVTLGVLFALAAGSIIGQSALGGLFSAAYAWRPFSILTILDAALRLCVAVCCFWAATGPRFFSFAAVAGSISWIIVLIALPRTRPLALARADVNTRTFVAQTFSAVAASAASAVLVMGFPVLLKIATPGQLPEGTGALLLAVTLTRAPLLVPLNVFQGALVAWFTDRRDQPWKSLRTTAIVSLGVGTLCALLASFLGPWVISSLFHVYWPFSSSVLAVLTVGASLIALLTCSGIACLACGKGTRNVLGWWIATCAALALLLMTHISSLTVQTCVCLAVTVGPLLGLAFHLTALRNP